MKLGFVDEKVILTITLIALSFLLMGIILRGIRNLMRAKKSVYINVNFQSGNSSSNNCSFCREITIDKGGEKICISSTQILYNIKLIELTYKNRTGRFIPARRSSILLSGKLGVGECLVFEVNLPCGIPNRGIILETEIHMKAKLLLSVDGKGENHINNIIIKHSPRSFLVCFLGRKYA